MKINQTLVLTRSEIANLMNFGDYVDAVKQAFLSLASGEILGPGVMDVPAQDGMFHVKGAGMAIGENLYVAVKVNGNFPENKTRFGLPTIQGAILLCDGIRGNPLAFLDSTEITVKRTGAATAVAAKFLARSDSKVAMICGCGKQGEIQLIALKHILPIERAFAYDQDQNAAKEFASAMSDELGIRVIATENFQKTSLESDVIVTCTTSKKYFLRKEDVSVGAFVAAVGADSHNKQEIDPALLGSNKVVTDIVGQCARIGDLHHAIEAKLMSEKDVYADLHEIVSGTRPGRISEEEIIIFDSTGIAIQDVAAAAVVYQRAIESRVCKFIDLSL